MKSPELHIRPARVEEAAALTELCLRSKALWGYDTAFMELCRAALTVAPASIAAGDVWVGEVDAERVGMVALFAGEPPGTLDLGLLFVAPGRTRSGFGRVLLAHAVAEAKRRGARRLTILADPNAAGFYERQGARRLGMAPSDAIPGRLLPRYEIRLASATG